MTITRDNYEIFFMDYMDGNLNPNMEKELKSFLIINPDLAELLDEMMDEPLVLKPETISFSDKSILKKTEFSDDSQLSYFDQLCILDIENEITQSQKKELLNLISTKKDYKKAYELYQSTVLHPDNDIIYKNKRALKKFVIPKIGKQIIITVTSAAAATIIYFSVFNQTSNPNYLKISENIQIKNSRFESQIKNNPKKRIEKTTNIQYQNIKPNKRNKLLDNQIVIVNNTTLNYKLEAKDNSDVQLKDLKTHTSPLQYTDWASLNPETETNTTETLTIKQFLRKKFKKNVLKTEEDKKVTFFAVAQRVVNGYSRISGAEIKLESQYNEKDELVAWALVTPNMEYKSKKRKH